MTESDFRSVDAADRPPGYFRVSRTATYGFLAALPLLAAYEVLIAVANGDEAEQVRISADIWMKSLFTAFGATSVHVLSIAVVVVGIAIVVIERKKKIPLRAQYAMFMIGESALYAVAVGLLVSRLTAALFAAAAVNGQMAQEAPLMQLALSIGAGVYEELFFRVLLVGGLFWVLSKLVSEKRVVAFAFSAVVGALVFSAVHYIGELGDPFEWSSFFFRAVFGLVLNVIFLLRGFGIAAWTHALYDILVTLVLI